MVLFEVTSYWYYPLEPEDKLKKYKRSSYIPLVLSQQKCGTNFGPKWTFPICWHLRLDSGIYLVPPHTLNHLQKNKLQEKNNSILLIPFLLVNLWLCVFLAAAAALYLSSSLSSSLTHTDFDILERTKKIFFFLTFLSTLILILSQRSY